MKLTGIVLAGGKSRRMGSDKGLMDYKGKKLIEYPLSLLTNFCDEIIISSNSDDYLQFGYPVIRDEITDSGPAGGLAAALKISENEWNLVLSCDVPLINKEAVEYLISSERHGLGLIPVYEGKAEPLIALYNKLFRQTIETSIKNGVLKMQEIIRHPEISFLDFKPVITKYPDLFRNFNFAEDLKE